MAKKILVVAAHPDDDIIKCGGSLAKHAKMGATITVCYLTSGDAGSLEYSKAELAKIREKEASNAAKVIGIQNLVFLRNPDGYLEYNRDNLVKLIELIRKEKPNVVYMHDAGDYHSDHRIASQLTGEAVMRASGPWFQECKGEPWKVGTVLAGEFKPPLAGVAGGYNYVEDISDFMDKKLAALQEHKSQVKNIDYSASVESLARYRAVTNGVGKYAEVFKIVKAEKIF